MFRFFHLADIHLDSPLRGLDRYPGAPVEEMRGATRDALAGLVGRAIEEEVSFLLIAGDVYDGDWKDYHTGLFFAHQMARLRAAGIRVFLVSGNHDAESRISRRLRLPENVYVFPSRAPGTAFLEEVDVAIHGQGFARREVPEDLSRSYPPARRGCFNIGLLHTNVGGRPGHENYAPSTFEGLAAKGYDYWALGHVHQREVLSDEPWIIYPGNIQGRHARETGAKGATLVTVDGGRVAAVEHVPCDVLRWSICEVVLSERDGIDQVMERAAAAFGEAMDEADGRPLAVRLRLEGAARAHRMLLESPERWREELRALATDAGRGRIWIEKVEMRLAAPPEDAGADEALGGLFRAIEEITSSETEIERLGEELADLRRKLPGDALRGEDALDLESPRALRALLEEARDLLVPRLCARRSDR